MTNTENEADRPTIGNITPTIQNIIQFVQIILARSYDTKMKKESAAKLLEIKNLKK